MTVTISSMEDLVITNNAKKIDQSDEGKCFLITYRCGPGVDKDEQFSGRRALIKVEPDGRLIVQFGEIPCRRYYLVIPSWNGETRGIEVTPLIGWCFQPGSNLPRLYTHPVDASQYVWVDPCIVETISEIPEFCLPELFRSTVDRPIDHFSINSDLT